MLRTAFAWLFGHLQKWLFRGWLVLPASWREASLRKLGGWFPLTTRSAARTLGKLGGARNVTPPLEFLKRAYLTCNARLVYQLSRLALRWLKTQRHLRSIDQKWVQSFPAYISVQAVHNRSYSQKNPLHLDGSLLTKLIHECKRNGTTVFILTGDEPLLHPRALTLIRSNLDSLFVVHASGRYLTDLVIDAIFHTGNVLLYLHLAGFQAENDAILGEGFYTQALAAMERLRMRGIPFGINLITRSDNYRIVTSQGFIEHLLNLGTLFLKYDFVQPDRMDNLHLLPNAAERLEVASRSLEIRNAHPVFALEPLLDTCKYAGCIARLGLSVHIDVNGEVQPCKHITFADHSLGEGHSLREIINRKGLIQSLHSRGSANLERCYFFDQPQILLEKSKGHNRRGFNETDPLEILEKMKSELDKWSNPKPPSFYAKDSYREVFQFMIGCLIPD